MWLGARKPLLWLAGLIFTTVAVPQLLGAVETYGNASRDAAALTRSLADEAMESISTQLNSIEVLVGGLTPASQIVIRCAERTLPEELDPATVCPDAALDEIVEEQQESLVLRRNQLEAQALGRRLGYSLEDTSAAEAFSTLAEGVRIVRAMETSDLCNEERSAAIGLLAEPVDPAAVSRDWVHGVRDALVGPSTTSPRCDRRAGGFRQAMSVAGDRLQEEAAVVSGQITRSKVKGLDDRPLDLARSTLNWPAVAALLLAAVIFLAGNAIRPVTPREPDVVD